MRTFIQLSLKEQDKVKNLCLHEALELIINNIVRFDNDIIQLKIDAAIKRSIELETPWFVYNYILEHDAVREVIESMALEMAESAEYPNLLEDGSYTKVIQL